jgi:hypothetical protein
MKRQLTAPLFVGHDPRVVPRGTAGMPFDFAHDKPSRSGTVEKERWIQDRFARR